MSLYIYQIFSLCHVGRANLQCDTNIDSNLISKDLRSWGLSRDGVSFYELMIEIWFTMDKRLILREFNLLQGVTMLFLIWNITTKSFYLKLRLLFP